jgi:predicted SprT family Zn-dependent metalloprotease
MAGKSRKTIARELCQMFGVKYRGVHRSLQWGWAYANVFEGEIFINLGHKCTKNVFISAVLHEICHIIAHRQGKFKLYHADNTDNKDNIRAILRTGLRAERYVDNQAKALMKGLFPGMRYDYSYLRKEDVLWFHEVQLKHYKKLLLKNKLK